MASIGIDLGTTHSLVAAVLSGKARCLLDDDGAALLPSALRFSDDGELVALGADALAQATDEGGTTFTSVKRFMGRAPSEVAAEAALFHYDLDPADERVTRFRLPGRSVTPVELSSMLLGALASRAEECLFGAPDGAVITVPAYFDDAQRQATRDAARIAGLEVLRLLNEPTAAALAYGLSGYEDGIRVAVYDLGGGTFDISILELNGGVFQVLSTAGDTRLGGDDFDQALAQVLLQQSGNESPDGRDFRRAVMAAEEAKRRLSSDETATVSLELSGRAIEASIARGDFERLIRPIVERTGASCRQALADAGLQAGDIDEAVLVGGSTRIPLVRSYVEGLFGRKPHTGLDPDRVVAIGAAVQADLLGGESELAEDMLLIDVLPLSLGLEVMGGVVERLLPRCTPVPATASQTFTTHADGQSAMKLHVLQGERELVQDNRSLGTFSLKGLPDLPAGTPRIKVDFTVDADGILRVRAFEEFTGAEASIEVQPSYGIAEEEIEQMLEDAIDNAETDVDARLLIEAKVEAEQVLRSLESSLGMDAGLATEGELQSMGDVSASLRAAIEEEDRRRISDLTHRLDEVSAPFAQRRIERDLAIVLEGRTAEDVSRQLGIEA
jgi:molecular chaperone HscA